MNNKEQMRIVPEELSDDFMESFSDDILSEEVEATLAKSLKHIYCGSLSSDSELRSLYSKLISETNNNIPKHLQPQFVRIDDDIDFKQVKEMPRDRQPLIYQEILNYTIEHISHCDIFIGSTRNITSFSTMELGIAYKANVPIILYTTEELLEETAKINWWLEGILSCAFTVTNYNALFNELQKQLNHITQHPRRIK